MSIPTTYSILREGGGGWDQKLYIPTLYFLGNIFLCHESQPMFFLRSKLSSLGDKNKGVGTNAKNSFRKIEPKLPYLEVETAKAKQ
jgi:hypothetical protein